MILKKLSRLRVSWRHYCQKKSDAKNCQAESVRLNVCPISASRGLMALLLLLLIGTTQAQVNPDPELQRELQRQRIQREEQERQQRQQQPDVRLKTPLPLTIERLPEQETPCFPITRILLTGDSAAHFAFALQTVLTGEDAAVGRCLGANSINLVLTRVQNAIIARGFVTTRVLAAPQDLKSGTLQLTVLPGRIRAIRFAQGSNPRGTLWNALPAQPGDILNLRDIEQALENLKRVPTAEADIQIEPSRALDAQPGESDLVIRYQQSFPFRLNLSVDDSGAKATGKTQGAITVSYDHALTLNDLLYVSLNQDLGGGDAGARGTRGYTAHYSLPFGYWLLGTTVSHSSYRQAVAGLNQTYLYSGESDHSEIKLSRLIYRDAVRKTTLSLRGLLRESRNFVDDTEVEVQRRRTAGWEAALNHREFIGPATLDGDLAWRRGTGALQALPAPEESLGEGTSRFKIITAALNLVAPLRVQQQKLRYTGTWRAQWNRSPLVPQDRFAIAGRYTVRGFDGENVLSAERGWLLRNELALALGQSGQETYVGVDHGEVNGAATAQLLGRRLTGLVLGLRGGYKDFFYDLFAGQPIKKPEGFRTAGTTLGFNLIWSF